MNQQFRANRLDVTELERIHLIVAFVLGAAEMRFAKAAAIANVSPLSRSRKASKLEDILGTRLSERTTRRLVFTDLGATGQFKHGEAIETMHVSVDFRSDSSEAIYEAALHGAGPAVIARYICDEAITRGAFMPVLPEWTVWPETDFYVCYALNKHLQPKTRALSDFLVQRLRNTLR